MTMPTAPFAPDAELFEALHEEIASQGGASNRRHGERHTFTCDQLMAPFDGEKLPRQADFRLTRCRDLSLHGISFIVDAKPKTEFMVVALGQIPFKFLVARVMHISSAETPQGREFTVGCRFERRLA